MEPTGTCPGDDGARAGISLGQRRPQSPRFGSVRDIWSALKADWSRYAGWSGLAEPGFWATSMYRFGQLTLLETGPLRPVLSLVYLIMARSVRLLTLIELPRTAVIDEGLRINHFGPVIVNAGARIGKRCTLRPGVIVGQGSIIGSGRYDVPTIGDDVSFGAHSMAIGAITVGNAVTIGAMTLVNRDVPDGARVVGVPARIVI